jgi:hypothetical protein
MFSSSKRVRPTKIATVIIATTVQVLLATRNMVVLQYMTSCTISAGGGEIVVEVLIFDRCC